MIPDIIPISAKEAREAETILNQPNLSQEEYSRGQKLLEQSNLKALFDLLNRTFLANSLQLQVQSKTRNCQELYGNLRSESVAAINVLKQMDATLTARIEELPEAGSRPCFTGNEQD